MNMNGLVTMDYHPHHPLYWHRHHQQHGKRLCRSMSKPFKAGGELSGDLCYRGHTPYMDVAILLRTQPQYEEEGKDNENCTVP